MPTKHPWSKQEDARLMELIELHGRAWKIIQWHMWLYEGHARRSASSYERRFQRLMLLRRQQQQEKTR